MEILLENVRNTIFNKKTKTPHVAAKVATMDYARVAFIVASSFLLGRVALLYTIFPCGIALITVLMSKGRVNIYTLPIILGGLLTNYGTGYELWGDVITTAICGIVFFLLNKIRIEMVTRAFIAAGIMVLTKSIYYIMIQIIFIYDVFMMCMEAMLILAFVYILNRFFSLIDKEETNSNSMAESVIATTAVLTLLMAGIGLESIGVISPVYLGSLFVTLFIGYKMGVMEGGVAGITSGIITMIVTSGSPAVIGIFACGGMVSGFFKGLNRLVVGTCFAAICLAFGLIKGYPELYISIYDPLLAAGIFILIPSSIMQKTELIFAKIRQDDIYYELIARDRMKDTLKGYLETFEKLSLLYAGKKNTSSILAMQFKGMAKVVKTMMEEFSVPTSIVLKAKEKYDINVGVSGYAKEDNVSGDSYVCADLKEGEYIIALSDGMGKGEKASRESVLTVTTLYNLMKAGFDVELALKTINSLLLLKSTDEIFSTVDLGLFNKATGKIKLFKIGAAATFIKRGNKVETIKVSALPMGIVDSIKVSNIEIQARRGDEIIIVSDGITEADRSDEQMKWIKETILNIRSKDPQTMSDLIINKAVERYGLKEKDDMTVITAIIN